MMKKIIYWILLIVVLIAIAGAIYIVNVVNTIGAKVIIEQDTIFQVTEEESWSDIINNLKEQNIVSKVDGIDFYINFRKSSPKPAKYNITTNMNTDQVIKMISRGLLIKPEVTITIPEGSDIYTIGDILESGLKFSRADFIKATEEFDTTKYDFIENKSLQGYLYPDTYRFFDDSNAEAVIIKMLNNFQKKALPSLKSNDKLSMYESLILASIVEKEVAEIEDRKIVAGIFINRLKDGMKLQSDATVNFITQSGRSQSTLEDLKINSPYNTYQVTGLPPGPITNPSVEAIQSVVKYTPNDYYFILTSRDNPPKTIFSKTFEEHLKAKKQYLP
ncbi:MAG: endolytic transglycosylase MltG [Candidatus Paceibacterota bacterium]